MGFVRMQIYEISAGYLMGSKAVLYKYEDYMLYNILKILDNAKLK